MKRKFFKRTKTLSMHLQELLIFFLIILFCSCTVDRQNKINVLEKKTIEVRGIYGSPEPFWRKNIQLGELGINAIFMHDEAITETIISRAKSGNIKVYAEFATLNGKGYVEEHPEAWAIDQDGKKVEAATWFMGVCPTEPGFRKYRKSELRTLLRRFDLDGIWMDYLHWHAQFEDPEPILPETCFCDHCLTNFQSASGITLPAESTPAKAKWILKNHDSTWRSWRCTVIADWVRDFKMILTEERPGALLGIFHCPWTDTDFNGARIRTLGLDYDLLKDIADVFSPMVYHGRMGKSPEWVKENTEWFCTRLNIKPGSFPKVWPIVQAYNDPGIIDAGTLEKLLQYGTTACATGVMMFTSNAVAEDEEKIKSMKKIYTSWE
jgi:hypothetical protein